MKSTRSTQKRQTFFLRTKLRLPRLAGPPGRPPPPCGRGPDGPPPGPDGGGACCGTCPSDIRFLLMIATELLCPINLVLRAAVAAQQSRTLLNRCCRLLAACRRGCGWSRRDLARAARGAAFAMALELLLPLQFFVHANGEIFHHRVGNLEPPLEFLNHFSVSGLQHHVNVVALTQLLHAIGHPLPSPLVHGLDLAAFISGGVLHRGDHFVDIRLRRIRPADENQVVLSLFHVSSISGFSTSSLVLKIQTRKSPSRQIGMS